MYKKEAIEKLLAQLNKADLFTVEIKTGDYREVTAEEVDELKAKLKKDLEVIENERSEKV